MQQTPTPSTAPATSPSRRAKFLVGGGIIALVLIGLIVYAMGRPSATSFYMTTTELAAAPAADLTQDFRVNGKLVKGSVVEEGVQTTFDISDGETSVRVTTDQPLPDAFYSPNTVDIVAQGRYDGDLFTASSVFAKCPSKFKAKA